MINFHTKLKTITKPLHDEIEQNQYAKILMSDAPTLDAYKEFLAKMLCFVEPIEKSVCGSPKWRELGFDTICLQKAQNIRDDLDSLLATNINFTSEPLLPNLDNFTYAIGVWYVLEGSMIGASMQAPIFKKCFGFDDNFATKYLLSYGAGAMQVFREFMSNIQKVVQTDEDERLFILGACDTYLSLKLWLDKNNRK